MKYYNDKCDFSASLCSHKSRVPIFLLEFRIKYSALPHNETITMIRVIAPHVPTADYKQ